VPETSTRQLGSAAGRLRAGGIGPRPAPPMLENADVRWLVAGFWLPRCIPCCQVLGYRPRRQGARISAEPAASKEDRLVSRSLAGGRGPGAGRRALRQAGTGAAHVPADELAQHARPGAAALRVHGLRRFLERAPLAVGCSELPGLVVEVVVRAGHGHTVGAVATASNTPPAICSYKKSCPDP
jgi:hypothetical protein